MKRRQGIILLLMLMLFSGVLFSIHQIYLTRMNEYKENNYEEFDFQVSSVLDSHEKFSEYLFSTLVEEEYVLKTVYEAYYASDTERAILREELAEYLKEDYDLITQYDFRQLHFHFKDNTSFLRMHKQDIFGDDLTDVRYSVWLTNETYSVSIGFEESKIYNGFRFVYPLSYNNKHIGSVEFSISAASVINGLTKLYETYDYGMLMSKDVVDEKVLEDQLEHYTPSTISDNFYDDVEVLDDVVTRNNLETYQINDLLSRLEVDDFEGDFDTHFYITEYNEDKYEVVIVPLANIQNKEVGYFYSITTNDEYSAIREELIINIIILFTVTVGLGVLIYMIDSKRELLKTISETDQLTGIYNRRKFEKVFHLEYERAKRYNSEFSLIMFDLDYFKNVNDQFGHQTGDDILVELCNVISPELRVNDSLARYGGEEFIIILPETSLINALEKANMLSDVVSKHEFEVIKSLTISMGLASYKPNLSEAEILRKADEALYKAKNSGRNKVITTMEM